MARYTYNAGLVTQALEDLNSGCNCLKNTNVDIQKGINMITNARGAENIKIDFSPILNNQSAVVDFIEKTSKEIKGKAQEIEEYQSAPWWKKVFATIGMGALKIVEGLATFVEQIGDGLVSIVGFVGGLFSSDFSDCIGEYVKKDWVGDTAAQWYEEGWLKGVNKYSVMSHQSTAANVLKGVGTAAGYVILSVCTAGAGTAVSLGVSAAAAAAGGIGAGTQSGLQQGMSFNQAFGQGVKQGAVAAATTLVIGGVANKLTAGARAASAMNSVDEVANAANSTKNAINTFKTLANSCDEMANLADDVAKLGQYADEVANLADDAVQLGGTTVKNANQTLKSAQDLAKQAKHLKDAAKLAGASDDVLNSLDDVINQADDALKLAKTSKSAVAAAQGTDTVAKEGNKISNAISNSKVGQAASNVGKAISNSKIGQAATNLASKAASSKAGVAVANLATKAGPVATNALAAGAGTVTGGMSKVSSADMTFNQIKDNTTTPQPGPLPDNNTNTTYNPNNGSGGGTGNTSSNNNTQNYASKGGSTSSGNNSSTYKVTTPDTVKLPNSSGGNTGGSTSGNTGGSTGGSSSGNGGGTGSVPNTGGSDDFVGKVSNVGGSTGGSTHASGVKSVESTLGEKSSSDVLDTFGQAAGSLSNITGSDTSIPTSSSPILSSTSGESGKSMVPLGAGLGAAALSGIGAKVYLDKREQKEEDRDELETEDWENEQDVEIDYGLEREEEADYLNPTDELAFQE